MHGDDFVEKLEQGGRLSKRDMGELRSIAAEIQREALADRKPRRFREQSPFGSDP